MDEPEKTTTEIGYNQFVSTTCTINQEDCDFPHCTTCETAQNYVKQEQADAREAERQEFTVFDRIMKHTPGCQVNASNTILKTDAAGLKEFIDYARITLPPLPYTPTNLKQYPLLRKLRAYNSLGAPDELLGKKDTPGAFRWGDTWYVIAPRVEPEE